MQIYRFGAFELDLDSFELRLPGQPVKLERRALDLLALLVKQPNRLVPREEIIAALWPPNVVIDFDSGLNTLVRKVRTALGDDSENPKFIETIPGRGYRFVASVESLNTRPETAHRARWPLIVAAVALLALAAPLVAWLDGARHEGPTTRIAVLPFENLTGDDDLAYLAAGLAEETGTALSQVEGRRLRVVRVLSAAVGQSEPSLRHLGEELGVDFIVQSAMRLDTQRIRVTSRLVRVADEEEVWSAGIDRAMTNVLGVQRELSTAIAEQVRLRLSSEVAAAIAKRQTQNPAAYALYLKGRYEWNKLTPAGTRRALEYLDEATKLDPAYALAWSGLAWGAITAMRSADVSPMVAAPIAKHALEEALRLGPDLVETQVALGYYRLFHELDQRGAEQAARKAIELDPDNAVAHQLLGVSLMRPGHGVEALDMMRRARELEPMFTLAFANSANISLANGDVAGALEFARQAIAIDPAFWLGHFYLGRAEYEQGNFDRALRALDDAARLSDGHSLTYLHRVTVLLKLNRRDEARALVAELHDRAATGFVPPYILAAIELQLGNRDAAFAQLEQAIEVHDINLLGMQSDARLKSLHDDPRFEDLVRRCNCSANSISGR